MASIQGILLAAGTSTRMGSKNKLLLPFKGEPMIVQVIRQIQMVDQELTVVLGHESDMIEKIIADVPHLKIVVNPRYSEGMHTSLLTGLKSLQPSSNEAVMVCLGDMPFLTSADYQYCIDSFRENPKRPLIQQPFFNNVSGHPVIFSSDIIPELIKHINQVDEGARKFIRENKNLLSKISFPNNHCVADIDEPGDY